MLFIEPHFLVFTSLIYSSGLINFFYLSFKNNLRTRLKLERKYTNNQYLIF